MYATAASGHVGAVRMLLHVGVSLRSTKTTRAGHGFIMLDVEAENGRLEAVPELVQQRGIEGCGGASGGVHALAAAARRNFVDIMAMLMDACSG